MRLTRPVVQVQRPVPINSDADGGALRRLTNREVQVPYEHRVGQHLGHAHADDTSR